MALKIPPPLVLLITAILMKFTPDVGIFSSDRRIILLLVGLAAVLDVASLWHFYQAKTTINPLTLDKTTQLVTHGIYRFTRNPMYLSLVLYLVAWGVWLGNSLALFWVFGFVRYITRFQIMPEEKMLTAKFGQNYTNYQKKVRRWI